MNVTTKHIYLFTLKYIFFWKMAANTRLSLVEIHYITYLPTYPPTHLPTVCLKLYILQIKKSSSLMCIALRNKKHFSFPMPTHPPYFFLHLVTPLALRLT